jgi:hypothetical protein
MDIKQQQEFLTRLAPEGSTVMLSCHGFDKGAQQAYIDGKASYFNNVGWFIPWRTAPEHGGRGDLGLLSIERIFLTKEMLESRYLK